MAVTLTVSKTINGAQIADALAGGSAGWDIGQVSNTLGYAPYIDKLTNDGWANIFAHHNAVVDPITEVATYIGIFPGIYGGANPAGAAGDISDLIAMGAADPANDKNNAGGLSQGLRIDHAGITIGANPDRFDPSTARVRIYGHDYGAGNVGVDLASAVPLHTDALIWDNGGVATDASAPQTGVIGVTGDTVLGDTAWVGMRFYLNNLATEGGIMQFAWIWSYSYTA
jgi:hypothetical protein